MTPISKDDLLDHATEFTFHPKHQDTLPSLVDGQHFSMRVVWRGEDSWAVMDGAYCVGRRGITSYESNPSSRTDRFLKAYRFTRDEAIAIAVKYVDHMTVNGRTYVQWQQHWADVEATS